MATTPRGVPPTTPREYPVDAGILFTPRPSSAPSLISSNITYNNVPPHHRYRDPILGEGVDFKTSPSGKKSVPSYYDNLQEMAEKNKSGKGRHPGVDITRAGLPTFIQKIRVHDEDIFVKRPSTAPSRSTTLSLSDSSGPVSASTLSSPRTPRDRARKACPIPHLIVKRNPLLENDDIKLPNRASPRSNIESEYKPPKQSKTYSKQTAHRTRPGYIPTEEAEPPVAKVRPFVPDDNVDVFYYRHSLGICPPDNSVLMERQHEKIEHEDRLKQAHRERKEDLNKQIQKHKERMERYMQNKK